MTTINILNVLLYLLVNITILVKFFIVTEKLCACQRPMRFISTAEAAFSARIILDSNYVILYVVREAAAAININIESCLNK